MQSTERPPNPLASAIRAALAKNYESATAWALIDIAISERRRSDRGRYSWEEWLDQYGI
jgi:hypothetical protein